MSAQKKVIKIQKKSCCTLVMWYLSHMKDTTTANATEVVEAFLKAVRKDAEMYSSPEDYVMAYLTASLTAMCRNEQGAMAYIQRSTNWMEQDMARQGR
jgi:hypothetical protein